MSKIIGILALLLVLALPASAQLQYPPEVIGYCPLVNSFDSVWMVPDIIDGPISVPIDKTVGYVGSVELSGSAATVILGPLTNSHGFPIAPPYPFYGDGKIFVLDTHNCHYRFEWVENNTYKYEIWLINQSGQWEWHSGDWDVGHGNSVVFGTWHTMYADEDIAEQFRMDAGISFD